LLLSSELGEWEKRFSETLPPYPIDQFRRMPFILIIRYFDVFRLIAGAGQRLALDLTWIGLDTDYDKFVLILDWLWPVQCFINVVSGPDLD